MNYRGSQLSGKPSSLALRDCPTRRSGQPQTFGLTGDRGWSRTRGWRRECAMSRGAATRWEVSRVAVTRDVIWFAPAELRASIRKMPSAAANS